MDEQSKGMDRTELEWYREGAKGPCSLEKACQSLSENQDCNYKRLVIIQCISYSVRNNACPLVRDKWLFTRTSKQSFSSYPSDKWKVTTTFYLSLYNAVIKLEEFMSWQAVAASRQWLFQSYCWLLKCLWSWYKQGHNGAKIRGGGAVSRYYVITTVCQLGHWQNLAPPFDVFSVLGSNIIARKPY